MDWRHYQSRLAQFARQRNGYLVLAAGLLLLCLILSSVIYSQVGRQRLVVVPPTVQKPFWISGTRVSSAYLDQLSLFLAQMRLSVDAESAPYQHKTLLRHADPTIYSTLKHRLAKERKNMHKQHWSTVFYPRYVDVNAHALMATVYGELATYVGKKQRQSRDVGYQLSYHRQNGRFLIQSFKEVSADD